MTQIIEVAPDLYRISTYVAKVNFQFNQFLILDDEPLLYHTGTNSLFTEVRDVRDAVAKVIAPEKIRWIGFSHFEADECGSLREWLAIAPDATAICSFTAKVASVDDVIPDRPARGLADGDRIVTGKYCFQFILTPHVPHQWEAGLLYEEVNGTLLCSDLFHQLGDVEPQTFSDVVGRFRQRLLVNQQGRTPGYLPYTPQTEGILDRLSALKPTALAAMHGSTFVGDGERAIKELAVVMREVLGTPSR